MAKVINVQQYSEEGFAIIQDTEGKYLVSQHTDKIEVIPEIKYPYIPRNPCALLQGREHMLT